METAAAGGIEARRISMPDVEEVRKERASKYGPSYIAGERISGIQDVFVESDNGQ